MVTGKDNVVALYESFGEAVLWNSDDLIAVADWGICDELTFHQLAPGAILKTVGYDVDDDDALYHVSSRQAFIWPYDDRARLIGENLYEDKTSLVIEEVEPRGGDQCGADPRDPPRAAGEARGRARRPLLGLRARTRLVALRP